VYFNFSNLSDSYVAFTFTLYYKCDMRKFNQKCYECGQIPRDVFRMNWPECYDFVNCRRKRSYYRDYEVNKLRQHRWHKWRKFRGTECFVCESKETIETHHIESRCLDENDTDENVVTLCKKCHSVITRLERKLGLCQKNSPRWKLVEASHPEPELELEKYKAMVSGKTEPEK
jgi:hypothetical protein